MTVGEDADPVCLRCGATIPDRETARQECPKPGPQYAKYNEKRKTDPEFARRNPPVGHSTSVGDLLVLHAREQAKINGPVVTDLIASAAEAEERLSPEELDYLDRRAADRAERSRRSRESRQDP
jgi:hypothetical protein